MADLNEEDNTLMDIDQIKSMLEGDDEYESGCGATDAEINTAMEQLDVIFPDEFIAFLRSFGWLEIGASEVFGLGSDVRKGLNLVAMTIEERRGLQPPLSKFLIPVLNDGFGNYHCIDCSPLVQEHPVVFWNHEVAEGQRATPVSSNFLEWLAWIVREAYLE